MNDPDIEARLNSGGLMVTSGIVVLVAAFLGTCIHSLSAVGEPNAALKSFETGQSPWLAIPMTLGIALHALGLVRKANARRDAKERYLEQHTHVDVVLDEEARGGPFRGDMKEMEVLDPAVSAAEEAERELAHRQGTTRLRIGGGVIALTVVGLLLLIGGRDNESPRRAMERFFAAIGVALIPFGIGLYLTIKGLLLRSE